MSDQLASDVACDYCGLPVPGSYRRRAIAVPAAPEYCCSGCRFAASVISSDATDGSVRRTLIKLGLGIFFAMNVMVCSIFLWTSEVYGTDWLTPGSLAAAVHDMFRFLALLCCLPVLYLLGEPVAVSVWHAIRRRVITTDLLLLVGVTAAVLYSLTTVYAGKGQVYFDVASMILLFVTLGRWFEAQGKLRSNRALDGIAKLLPPSVHLVENQTVVDRPREAVVVGQRLRVFPGERFGVDGCITAGTGDIDEQIVTGESRPVSRGPGDHVSSGTLNIDGDLEIEVTAAAGEETVSRMLELVRRSRRIRGEYQKLADRVTAWFVPVVTMVALLAAWWHGTRYGLDAGILAGLAVALIACPCALGLATPMAIWVALGRAASGHVLFRHGPSIEQLAGARALLFDKTGTITTGEAVVQAFVADNPGDEQLGSELAAQLAAVSNHCFSIAIQRYAVSGVETPPLPLASNSPPLPLGEGRGEGAPSHAQIHSPYPLPRGEGFAAAITDVRTVPGKGISARWQNERSALDAFQTVLLGSPQWLEEEGCPVAEHLWRAAEEASGADAPLSCIGWEGRVRGIFIFHEELRPEARSALQHCQRLGLQVAVATGDRRSRGERLAESLGVPVFAEQLPEDKVTVLRNARQRFGPVAMIGDGLNDAPALAASDIGMAMGCGADLSRESAAVCLLANDLSRLPWTIELARQTIRIIRQNLCWSFSYNIFGIALAATGKLSPVFSAFSMVASSAFVIANSLRLNRFPEPQGGTAEFTAQNNSEITESKDGNPQSAIRNPQLPVPQLQR